MFCFKQLPITDWRYVFVADLEALSCQVTRKFIRCRNAETRTISAINIPLVCALHEQCTHHRRSVKMSKIQIFFKIPIVRGYIFFPEGANPLCVPIYRESISKSQAGCW